MHQNILNNRVRALDSRLYSGRYYDFMLYMGGTQNQSLSDISGLSIANFSSFNIIDGKLYSTVSWSGAVSNGVVLKDIGFTGIDNGFISYDKDKISNEEFLEILTGSTYSIESGDTRFFMSPITGNTKLYSYPMELVNDGTDEYLACKGGFYQGFFKLEGFDYQVLPSKINSNIIFHFDIRPRTDYSTAENAVNKTHEGNEGIFFYMGSRAENKFWQFYNESADEYLKRSSGDTVSDLPLDYFSDDYASDYTKSDVEINASAITDSEGNYLWENEEGTYTIESDNKYLLFDRTPDGFTTHNWVEGTTAQLIGKERKDLNYFIYMNRTPTGYTSHDIDRLENDIDEAEGVSGKTADFITNIKNNAFALRVTENGAIGYRYGRLDCSASADNYYTVVEEYSKDGIVKDDEWNSINVKFSIINPTDECDTHKKEMKIYIYVNGFLKFVSKAVPAIEFKALDEAAIRQEGVPYNISLGGGTQGLMETIVPDYYKTSEYILPLERDFCGTFIGDIKSFVIYGGDIDYSAIKNYLS